MKWTSTTLNESKVRKTVHHVSMMGRTFGTLALCTVLFFVLLTLASYMQSKNLESVSPISSMKGFAASLSSHFFMDMIAMEVPFLKEEGTVNSFAQKNVLSFVFRFLTDINTHDPKTIVAQEVPGIGHSKTVLLRKGVATNKTDSPTDYPPASTFGGDRDEETVDPAPDLSPPAEQDPDPPQAAVDVDIQADKLQKKTVFIYHSHNTESFLPELPGTKAPEQAYDDKKNITLVGERMMNSLQNKGIGVVHSTVDYPATTENFKFAYSYKYSLETLQQAIATNEDLQYFFDIHRDSQVRSRTTTTIDGVDYAQIYFIVGEKNPNWKKNEQFAAQIHQVLEKNIPGISKGIYAKAGGNGEYNQSFSPNSVIVEIGGPYNTLEECYRTAEILVEAIAEVIQNAEKVGARERVS